MLGSEQGYPDRWQAIAVARLAKAEPAAVVQRGDTKQWCAVEATALFATGLVGASSGDATTGMSTALAAVHGVPSLAGLPAVIERVTNLKQRQAKLKATQPKDQAAKKALEAEEDTVRADLGRENLRRMALILGVAEGEIKWNPTSISRAGGRINVTGMPDPKSHGGAHGPVAGQSNTDFSPDLVTAIEIDENQFDDPSRVQSTLYHEAHHLMDLKLAQDWVRRYQTETNRLWVAKSRGQAVHGVAERSGEAQAADGGRCPASH